MSDLRQKEQDLLRDCGQYVATAVGQAFLEYLMVRLERRMSEAANASPDSFPGKQGRYLEIKAVLSDLKRNQTK